MKRIIRRQPPIKGGRINQGAGFEPRVWRAVQAEAARWHVSVPFVLSVMAADTLGISIDAKDRYDKKPAHVHNISDRVSIRRAR